MLDELLNQIDADLVSQKLIDPKIWIDRGMVLARHEENEKIKLAEIDVSLGKVIERIKVEMAARGQKVTQNAAENLAKLEPEWMEFIKQEAKVGRIGRLITSCNKHAARLY